MPANKNAMTRYKILDELLSDRYHNYSLDDLTREVSDRLSKIYPQTNGVVRRTIEKDIFYLEHEGPFMVEIDRYTDVDFDKETQKNSVKKCLRYSDPSYSLFKQPMSEDEEYLLSEALSLLGQFDGLPNLKTLEELRVRLGIKKSDRQIISLSKNPIETSNLLAELFLSISHHQVIELHYHIYSAPESIRHINLSPYLLKEYNRRWYLFGCAESDNKLLSFALDRIDGILPLLGHHYVECTKNLTEFFEDIIGVTFYEDAPVQEICFWVSDKSCKYVETKPIHESQRMLNSEISSNLRRKYSKLVGGEFFRIDCKENYELIRELMSFGGELLVLEPFELKRKIEKTLHDFLQSYNILEKD